MEMETQDDEQQQQQLVAMALEENHYGEESEHSHNNNNSLSPYLKKGSHVEVSSEEEGFKGSWFEAKVLEPPVKQKSKVKKRRLTLIEYANLLQDDGVTPLTEKVDCLCIRPRPMSERQTEVPLELYHVVDAFDRDGWWTGVVAQIEPDHTYMVAFEEPPHVLRFPRQSLRLHLDWIPISDAWSRPKKLKELPFSLDILNQRATPNHPNSVQDKRKEATNSGNLSRPSKKQKEKQYIISEPPLAVLFPSHIRFSQNKCIQPSLSEPDTPATPLLETGESGSRMGWNSARKKRSSTNNRRKRPSEFSIESDIDSTAGKEQESNEGALQPIVAVEEAASGLDFTCSVESGFAGPADEYRDILHDTIEAIDVTTSPEENVNVGTVGNLDEHSLSKDLHAPQVMESPSKFSSKKLCTPEVVEEPRNFPIMNSDPSNGVRDIEVAPELNNPTTGNTLSVQLPFIKNSPLWEAVESLEIFKMFPQNPHFLPLRDCKEVDREGLAIGRMVTFASTVEMTLKLKITDPIRSFNIHMESLLDLETYGFDIKPFQSRLQKKLATKVGHEKLQEMSKKAEGQMQELICKEKKIDKEIQELESKIRHLQEEFAENEFEIINIGTCKDVIHEMIKKSELDFEDTNDILL